MLDVTAAGPRKKDSSAALEPGPVLTPGHCDSQHVRAFAFFRATTQQPWSFFFLLWRGRLHALQGPGRETVINIFS